MQVDVLFYLCTKTRFSPAANYVYFVYAYEIYNINITRLIESNETISVLRT